MNQLPPDHQSQRKQERAQQQPQRQRHQVLPWLWYRGRTLKAKVALGSALVLVLLLLLVGVSVLTTKSVPFRNAGVHVTVTAGGPLYVSSSGNDSNDGSIAHPFASIQQASKVARPGTTIHVLPGVYTKSIYTTAKGTAQARITFISDVKWGAKISTTGVRTSWTNFGDFVDIQGFDITGDGDILLQHFLVFGTSLFQEWIIGLRLLDREPHPQVLFPAIEILGRIQEVIAALVIGRRDVVIVGMIVFVGQVLVGAIRIPEELQVQHGVAALIAHIGDHLTLLYRLARLNARW